MTSSHIYKISDLLALIIDTYQTLSIVTLKEFGYDHVRFLFKGLQSCHISRTWILYVSNLGTMQKKMSHIRIKWM